MSQTILIIGGNGFVGTYLVKEVLKQGFTPIIASRQKPHSQAVSWIKFDLSDIDSIESIIEQSKPHAVINLAAISDVDLAEREIDLIDAINVQGPAELAKVCQQHSIKLIHMSSDAVFEGSAESYSEDSETKPVNQYGRSKLESEVVVLNNCSSAVAIRVSLILGWGIPEKNSFLNKFVHILNTKKEIKLPQDEFRTPIDVMTLAKSLVELINHSFSGVLHLGSLESKSRFEIGMALAKELDFDAQSILPSDPNPNDTNRAPRHKNGILNVQKAQSILQTKMCPIDETIQRAAKTV